MNNEITAAYELMQGMTMEEQKQFNRELCKKLKMEYPDEFAEY